MKTLGHISVLGMAVKVILASPSEVNDSNLLSDNEDATFEPDTNTIRLNSDSCGRSDRTRFHLVHELMHAWFGHSGARVYLRELMRMPPEEFEKVEETVVRMLAPSINSSMDSLATLIKRLK